MADQRVAVVTGTSGGIGHTIATTLAAAGQVVVVGYAGKDAAAKACRRRDSRCRRTGRGVQAGIADEDAVAGLFDTATQSFGIIVNSAGRLSLSPKRAGSGGDRPTRRHGNLAVSAVDLDVQSQASVAVAEIVRRHSHLDVVVHNAGHIPSPTASRPKFYHCVGVEDLLSPNAAL